ncbi:hypothetical protein Psuf_017940 [Phytohabitans suffuscus]|uniref:Major facilitator superfamily (MFS) profile domain-containing protein n=1 Tax=Phytohabitans suffuscus TaxID=624315 RepID=A0A6F8YEV8_9ACTN|nr:MFS transporter [Phytohabitans suffuscus]BCB84481.1 hypothetical protein Psuf_017940 [Phytohabitans suffuscus]
MWGPITIPELIGAGALLMVIFFVHQYLTRDKEPLVPFSIFSDRNFSLMNWVVGAIAFSMLGLFLPLVIYLQSVIGLTALKAGIAIAPMSLLSMFIAPFAGRAADRMSGKWILFSGLTLWSAGMALVVWLARADAGQWTLLPGLLVAGAGLGMTFAPLQTIAMRDIVPRMAGAASGLINTSRQLGGVIGSAAVGALLQAQLATQLPKAAREEAGTLPAQYREQFVSNFSNASTGNLHVGAGQTGVSPPPGLPEQARQAIAGAAEKAFREGFTHAMRVTLILPLAVLAAAALSCLFIRGRRRSPESERDTAHAAVAG